MIVTKLNGSINNDYLPHLGELRVRFIQNQYNNAKSQGIQVDHPGGAGTMTIKALSGNFCTDFSNPSWITELTIANSTAVGQKIYASNDNAVIAIYPVYGCDGFVFGGSGNGEYIGTKTVDLNVLQGVNAAYGLILKESDIFVDLGKLGKCKRLDIGRNNVITGSIDDLVNSKGTLNKLEMVYSPATGTLDTFLSGFNSLTLINVTGCANVIQKRSTITALQNAGVTVTYSSEYVIEDI